MLPLYCSHAMPLLNCSTAGQTVRRPSHRLHDELVWRLGAERVVGTTLPDCACTIVAHCLHLGGVVPAPNRQAYCKPLGTITRHGRADDQQTSLCDCGSETGKEGTHSTTFPSLCMSSCTAPSAENRGVSCTGMRNADLLLHYLEAQGPVQYIQMSFCRT